MTLARRVAANYSAQAGSFRTYCMYRTPLGTLCSEGGGWLGDTPISYSQRTKSTEQELRFLQESTLSSSSTTAPLYIH